MVDSVVIYRLSNHYNSLSTSLYYWLTLCSRRRAFCRGWILVWELQPMLFHTTGPSLLLHSGQHLNSIVLQRQSFCVVYKGKKWVFLQMPYNQYDYSLAFPCKLCFQYEMYWRIIHYNELWAFIDLWNNHVYKTKSWFCTAGGYKLQYFNASGPIFSQKTSF